MLYSRTLLIVISLFSLSITSPVYADSRAAVAMPDSYSANVAQAILDKGGNAIDAAVAASFSLAVTYPEAGNLGGGGFMLIHAQGVTRFLDYRETAPQAAHRNLYLDKEGEVIPYRSLVGYQASGVPGSVMGLWQAHQTYGQLSWSELIEPAIDLAKNGFIVHPKLVETATWYQNWAYEKADNLNFLDYFGNLEAEQTFKQPELANTLKRIAEHGADEFYQGETAQLIAKQMQANQGLITLEDLANYQVKWRQPVQARWQGYDVYSSPPPSSGGIALVQLLQMKAELSHEFEGVYHNSASYVHLLAEIKKRVYADRAEYLGDPDFYQVPTDKLIAPKYLVQRAKEVNPIRISPTPEIKPGLVESEQTTHFSILDAQGNAVSNTTTLNMPFGSGVVIKGAGFLMNDEMDDFSAKPGVPNVFGVIGGEANAIAANKRMLSSMTPTILLRNGQVSKVIGTPGGSTIITSVFQALVNNIEFDMTAQQAVDASRVHHQLWPKDEIGFHPSLDANTIQTLTNQGYTVSQRRFFGDLQFISRSRFGDLEAASDQRGRGESRVWIISE
ncbi:MAG: gamma-glutamyltransferase [Thiomicrospira sp.]|uniref:gamma-glutamyltransferase n=1 Tax=Thiomicrospira sp. TaxID=935 RepID=UPI0019F021DF|nr:gamma-glutamyltransferase [Thiomicrospira sp.]MBE0493181.1 gamma-glutamyltransferase [Thiomicrospira sp.]